MPMLREMIYKWTEESGLLGEIQDGVRRGRSTENNLVYAEEFD